MDGYGTHAYTQTGALSSLWSVERARISSGTPKGKQHESQACMSPQQQGQRRSRRLADTRSGLAGWRHRASGQAHVARVRRSLEALSESLGPRSVGVRYRLCVAGEYQAHWGWLGSLGSQIQITLCLTRRCTRHMWKALLAIMQKRGPIQACRRLRSVPSRDSDAAASSGPRGDDA